jgi:hypothetical protein
VDGPAVEGCPFCHADEAVSFLVGRLGLPGVAGWAGVLDADSQFGSGNGQRELGLGVGAGVLEGVGERFLDDAVDRQLDTAVQGVDVAGGAVEDLWSGAADAGAQCGDVGDAGLRAEPAARSPGRAVGRPCQGRAGQGPVGEAWVGVMVVMPPSRGSGCR